MKANKVNRGQEIRDQIKQLDINIKKIYKTLTSKKLSQDHYDWYSYEYNGLLMKRQILFEESILPTFKKCNKSNTIDLQEIDKLKEQYALEKYLTFSFYQAGLMETLFCSFDTELVIAKNDYQSNTSTTTPYSASKMVTKFLTKLRKIGGGVEGYALFAGFGNVKDLFVIKVPKKVEDDNLFHEYFVGVTSLNKLRRSVPSFSYIFGAFRCLPPIINDDNSVTEWCQRKETNGVVNYVLYEKVNGPTFKAVMAQCTATEYISYLLQLFFALRQAWLICDFTHYDLHYENVILREVKMGKNYYVPYPIKDNEFIYILTNRIPTLIDYGRCHVLVEDKHYGYYSILDGIFPEKSRPFHDLYKIMMFTLFYAYRTNNIILLETMLPLVTIWPAECGSGKSPQWDTINSIDQLIIKLKLEEQFYFELGPQELLFESESDDPYIAVINRIMDTYPNIIKKLVKYENNISPNDTVFDCTKMQCTTLYKFKEDLTKQ